MGQAVTGSKPVAKARVTKKAVVKKKAVSTKRVSVIVRMQMFVTNRTHPARNESFNILFF